MLWRGTTGKALVVGALVPELGCGATPRRAARRPQLLPPSRPSHVRRVPGRPVRPVRRGAPAEAAAVGGPSPAALMASLHASTEQSQPLPSPACTHKTCRTLVRSWMSSHSLVPELVSRLPPVRPFPSRPRTPTGPPEQLPRHRTHGNVLHQGTQSRQRVRDWGLGQLAGGRM